MSVRTRLVLCTTGLVLVGLVISGGATFGALQDWRSRQADDLLATAAGQVAVGLSTGSATAPELADAVGRPDPLWRAMAERGDVPSFFQLRSADGRVRDTVAFGTSPVLPDPLPPGAGPASVAQVHSVQGAPDPGGDPEPWRVRVEWLAMPSAPDGGLQLLVGQRSTASAELIARTLAVMVTTGIAVLAALAVAAVVLIRRGLRPLDEIADTATAIGSGDLGRRVQDTSQGTEVGRLGAALNAMLARLEDAFTERARSEDRLRRFVADASHELRTPLATVRGYAELFRLGAARRPDDLADAMHRIETEAVRMSELVDELLLLARLDQGRPLERLPVDLGELAGDAVDAARLADPGRRVELQVSGDPVLDGDAARLRQVVSNLLANVAAHTPPGAPAEVRVRGDDASVVLEVADTGPGVPAAERERVFERFHQVPARPGHRGPDRAGPDHAGPDHAGPDGAADPGGRAGGAGLGLAIVAAVVHAHGGRSAVGTEPGHGAVITVVLPRQPGPAASTHPDPGPPAHPDLGTGRSAHPDPGTRES